MNFKFALVSGIAAVALAGAASASTVALDIYNTFTDTGSGITFGGSPNLVTTLPVTSSGFYEDFNSGNVAGYSAANAFGADFKGGLSVATAGSYTLSFGTDDAGYLFVNGTEVASLPGTHPTQYASPVVNLHAGINTFEIQYDNTQCCGAVATLGLPTGVTEITAVPEPMTWALMLVGFGVLGAVARRRRSASLAA